MNPHDVTPATTSPTVQQYVEVQEVVEEVDQSDKDDIDNTSLKTAPR